jgi:SAM-dependent methyltransferase
MKPTLARLLAFLLALSSAAALAQAQKDCAEPTSGLEGKDVVWVPTPQITVDRMLQIARVGPKDFVLDLGSGDGRLVITAAKLGARGMGVEYNPELVRFARCNAEKEGVARRARFVKQDLFQTDLSQASVITLFLLTTINVKLRPKLLELKPGTRIVANTFNMGDWAPDATAEVGESCNSSWCSVLMWIVPAKVEGTWKVPQGEVSFKQRYQKLTGSLATEGKTIPLSGRVRGEEIRFTAGGRKYVGRLNGGALELGEKK